MLGSRVYNFQKYWKLMGRIYSNIRIRDFRIKVPSLLLRLGFIFSFSSLTSQELGPKPKVEEVAFADFLGREPDNVKHSVLGFRV